MKLADLRKLSIKQQTRIHFHLRNGMECVVTEHGIAQVPGLHAIPDFNLEEELASAGEFVLGPTGSGEKKAPLKQRAVSREELDTLVASLGGMPEIAHEEE